MVKDVFVVTIKVPSDLSRPLRSHLLDYVEHLSEDEAMLAENRVREVVEVRLAVFTPVLLSVFARRSAFHNGFAFAMDTRHRLAELGETETLEASFTWWKVLIGAWSASKIDVMTYRNEQFPAARASSRSRVDPTRGGKLEADALFWALAIGFLSGNYRTIEEYIDTFGDFPEYPRSTSGSC